MTLERWLNDTCPTGCQAFLDEVTEACEIGDPTSDPFFFGPESPPFSENFLFNIAVAWGEGHSSCDYGYTPSTCEIAFLHLQAALPCEIAYDLEPEELATSPCPAECQARYDPVQESCQVGDNLSVPFDYESDSELIYGEAFLWYEQKQYRMEECNFGGFIPDACAKAVSDLDTSVSDG